MSTRWVISCDTGIDDALALGVAVAHPGLDVAPSWPVPATPPSTTSWPIPPPYWACSGGTARSASATACP